ncbi:L-type lectin-domain containing receptor kinase IX.1-like [Rutidosis leptorrhynchoides]|uniref:L-type lectin-domain containing receptor kinase IX.1-like n=1 Tax=Rutidosis leptorrhynchoides TaxID=125765 RepID=UPI003A9A30EE
MEPKKISNIVLMVGFIVGLVLITVTILGVLVFVLLSNRNKTRDLQAKKGGLNNKELQMGMVPKQFSYYELASSTKKFAEFEKHEEGGFGGVYRAILKDSNTYVTVKKVLRSSKQWINEYASEIRIGGRLRHINLVQVIGWGHVKGELLLLYEYMENGSLDSHLFKNKSLLTWDTRYKIVHGLACALLHLHEECEPHVLHRDIKSSNVILDSNFNAKLGGFGLAKLVDHKKGSETTKMAQTSDYLAHECVVTGKETKSDVFGFGVVVLEIACGRNIIEYKDRENQIWLIEWIWELYGAGTLLQAVDLRLGSEFEEDEVEHLMMVGLWCVHPDLDVRPSMRQVIQVLKHEASMPRLPSKMPVSSY